MSVNKRIWWFLGLVVLATLGLGFGCSGSQGERGPAGASSDGGSCTVTKTDGGATISCPNGSTATISNGQSGLDGGLGTGCTAAETEAGIVVTCGDASVTVGNGQPGQPGLNAGETPGINVDLKTSSPANGQYFATGEKIVVTATITTSDGAPLMLSDLSEATLYMNGPRDMLKDKTAVGLLGASTDRTKNPHYEIDLTSTTNSNEVVKGNVITYTMNAITNEDPGTYTVGLYAVVNNYPLDQTFALANVQIGTATVEPEIVGNCADCHKGGANGKLYMHHILPGHSPEGEPAIDQAPIDTCLMCHNQDGYSAIQECADGTKASGGTCDDNSTPTYVADAIVHRVHGVHMGSGLMSPADTDPTNGIFADYTGVVFPADIKDCGKCHTDDSWQTKLSREACGSCHDNVNFATGAVNPPITGPACTTNSDCNSFAFDASCVSGACTISQHGGGIQTDDSNCATCHGPNTLYPVATVHAITPPTYQYTVNVAMSPPANGTDYEGGEAPTLTITLKDATTGDTIDPSTLTEANGDTAQLFVYGPREQSKPVLTTAADNPNQSAFSHYVYNDLRVRTNSANEDPKLTRTSTGYQYQLDPVTGLSPGTYMVFFRVEQKATPSPAYSYGLDNFQVGTATTEPMIATSCATGSCHEDNVMHGYLKFNPDACKACHDYQAQVTPPGVGWATGNNYGFGTTPLARRVHGVHFGHYVNYPDQITSNGEYASVIFPQDVRNCQTCHSTTSTSWENKPSRIACLACHDSDSDQAHAALMTVDPTPNAPYSGDEQESCPSCHGPGTAFSVATEHNITTPYVPPYPRDSLPSDFP
jgi:Outer membrane cytochrome MtrC/MtrF-like, domains II/IV